MSIGWKRWSSSTNALHWPKPWLRRSHLHNREWICCRSSYFQLLARPLFLLNRGQVCCWGSCSLNILSQVRSHLGNLFVVPCLMGAMVGQTDRLDHWCQALCTCRWHLAPSFRCRHNSREGGNLLRTLLSQCQPPHQYWGLQLRSKLLPPLQ